MQDWKLRTSILPVLLHNWQAIQTLNKGGHEMPEDKDKLASQPPSGANTGINTGISRGSGGIRIGPQKTAVQQRLDAAAVLREEEQLQQKEAAEAGAKIAAMMPNRICILPDCSGSMAGYQPDSRIVVERRAVDQFLKDVDFSNTSIAFNAVGNDEFKTPLLADHNSCVIAAAQIDANGGTPICEQLRFALENIPMTRAVLISDGEPTDGDPTELRRHVEYGYGSVNDGVALDYKEAGIPIDTIFIGDSGKKTMQQIAEITGGIFIEFRGSDVKKLAEALRYLTPKHRAMLMGMTEADAKQLLGASELHLGSGEGSK
jgi:Mg-chelatase subunit ChlD